MNKDTHLTDEELLLTSDGELGVHQLEQARRHLQSCWECRMRMHDLEVSIADFVRLHHATLDTQIPPPENPRRLLRARLSDAAKMPTTGNWQEMWRPELSALKAACALGVLFAVVLVAGMAWQHRSTWQFSAIRHIGHDPSLPDRRLTPGSFQPVRLQDVCGSKSYEQTRVNSALLAQEVLREYGMPNTAESKYEIDFLVIPELGGTQNIQNLWPEPYSSTTWNAHVKDQLEEHLHSLVCEQKLDLETAQRDIAKNWIAAYKKYFHTNRPLLTGSTS